MSRREYVGALSAIATHINLYGAISLDKAQEFLDSVDYGFDDSDDLIGMLYSYNFFSFGGLEEGIDQATGKTIIERM